MTLPQRLVDTLNGSELFIEADAPLSQTKDWVLPVALPYAMCAGTDFSVRGAVSPALIRNFDTIQDILASWIPQARRVRVQVTDPGAVPNEKGAGASLFFSGGVDSFYSFLKRPAEIDNLILVHGFDVPLEDEAFFKQVRGTVGEVASLFGKRLITARTDLRRRPPCCRWGIFHGPALAMAAHALAPAHATVYIGSSRPYSGLHTWGSHPLLDPLWSSENARIVHDGAETNRTGKLRFLGRHRELLRYIRVCWQNAGAYNCGRCEKCLRTMIALQGLGLLEYASFAQPLEPAAIRRVRLDEGSAFHWEELLALDPPRSIKNAMQHVLRNYRWKLPPHGSLRRELGRGYIVARQLTSLARAFLS